MQHFICKWVIASHVKSSFFLLCSLALCQQSSWMGSAVRAGGEGSVMQHHSEKEVKSCFLFWPGRPLARIFNKESWAQGITENYLRAARLLRSGLRLLWVQSLLERAKVPKSALCPAQKADFLVLLNVPSSWLPPCQHCCCCSERVVVIWVTGRPISVWYQDQYWKEQVVMELANLLASETGLGIWGVVFLELFRSNCNWSGAAMITTSGSLQFRIC